MRREEGGCAFAGGVGGGERRSAGAWGGGFGQCGSGARWGGAEGLPGARVRCQSRGEDCEGEEHRPGDAGWQPPLGPVSSAPAADDELRRGGRLGAATPEHPCLARIGLPNAPPKG